MRINKLLEFKSKSTLGYLISAVMLVLCSFYFYQKQDQLIMPGKLNTGHEELSCSDCHKKSDGTIRQQIQANVKNSLGLRQHDAFLRYKAINNDTCQDCHKNDNDTHQVDLFNEPRFLEVREKLHPEKCVSCHSEHNDTRVTLKDVEYCQSCHEQINMKNDPLDVSHNTLVKEKKFDTCLSCHDYHGNHTMKTPVKTSLMINKLKVIEYFDGKESPYGQTKVKAKKGEHQ